MFHASEFGAIVDSLQEGTRPTGRVLHIGQTAPCQTAFNLMLARILSLGRRFAHGALSHPESVVLTGL